LNTGLQDAKNFLPEFCFSHGVGVGEVSVCWFVDYISKALESGGSQYSYPVSHSDGKAGSLSWVKWLTLCSWLHHRTYCQNWNCATNKNEQKGLRPNIAIASCMRAICSQQSEARMLDVHRSFVPVILFNVLPEICDRNGHRPAS
jgi:hypothetical protein